MKEDQPGSSAWHQHYPHLIQLPLFPDSSGDQQFYKKIKQFTAELPDELLDWVSSEFTLKNGKKLF